MTNAELHRRLADAIEALEEQNLEVLEAFMDQHQEHPESFAEMMFTDAEPEDVLVLVAKPPDETEDQDQLTLDSIPSIDPGATDISITNIDEVDND